MRPVHRGSTAESGRDGRKVGGGLQLSRVRPADIHLFVEAEGDAFVLGIVKETLATWFTEVMREAFATEYTCAADVLVAAGAAHVRVGPFRQAPKCAQLLLLAPKSNCIYTASNR